MSASQLRAGGDSCSAHGVSVENKESNQAELAVQRLQPPGAFLSDYAQLLDLTQLLAYDLDGRIVVWTSGDSALYGWSKAEAVGLKVHDLLQTACNQPLEEINAVISTGASWEGELVRTDKAGRRITLASRWVLHRNPTGEPAAILENSNDITELKRDLFHARAELEQRAVDLETAVERTAKLYEMIGELEAFSYSVTHDLRAPLRSIRGFTEVLREKFKDHISGEAVRTLERIIGAAHRMDCLIQDVLALSRLAREDIKLEPVNLEQLFQRVLDSCADFQRPMAEIHVKSPLPTVIGNAVALTQCVSNLLSNAVKFVAPGVIPRVDIWAEQKADLIRLWFADNGIGIAPQYQAKVFGLFQRASSQYEGTGLGLAIVSRAALRMGGKVGVESALGKGSRFWIELPESPT